MHRTEKYSISTITSQLGSTVHNCAQGHVTVQHLVLFIHYYLTRKAHSVIHRNEESQVWTAHVTEGMQFLA